jgi:hypothetical protein
MIEINSILNNSLQNSPKKSLKIIRPLPKVVLFRVTHKILCSIIPKLHTRYPQFIHQVNTNLRTRLECAAYWTALTATTI